MYSKHQPPPTKRTFISQTLTILIDKKQHTKRKATPESNSFPWYSRRRLEVWQPKIFAVLDAGGSMEMEIDRNLYETRYQRPNLNFFCRILDCRTWLFFFFAEKRNSNHRELPFIHTLEAVEPPLFLKKTWWWTFSMMMNLYPFLK